MDAYLRGLATYLPEMVQTNDQLQAENPDWEMARIEARTGIKERRVARRDEKASDLAYEAAQKLFETSGIPASSVDYLIYCTQSPDYFAPATACILQHRLGLANSCGAIDINQGCSGYVYGLHLARALVISGSARNVLLVTAETYSKYIHPSDRQVRVLFGDAASASLISSKGPGAMIGEAVLGTDGSGAPNLFIPTKTTECSDRTCEASEGGKARIDRRPGFLHMNGQELVMFALRRVPQVVDELLAKNNLALDQIGRFICHQANSFMHEKLRERLRLDPTRMPAHVELVGNTVSNTIPLVISNEHERFPIGEKLMLIGFGVGYSWGACILDWDRIIVP